MNMKIEELSVKEGVRCIEGINNFFSEGKTYIIQEIGLDYVGLLCDTGEQFILVVEELTPHFIKVSEFPKEMLVWNHEEAQSSRRLVIGMYKGFYMVGNKEGSPYGYKHARDIETVEFSLQKAKEIIAKSENLDSKDVIIKN